MEEANQLLSSRKEEQTSNRGGNYDISGEPSRRSALSHDDSTARKRIIKLEDYMYKLPNEI